MRKPVPGRTGVSKKRLYLRPPSLVFVGLGVPALCPLCVAVICRPCSELPSVLIRFAGRFVWVDEGRAADGRVGVVGETGSSGVAGTGPRLDGGTDGVGVSVCTCVVCAVCTVCAVCLVCVAAPAACSLVLASDS